jgi:hypothetical protein
VTHWQWADELADHEAWRFPRMIGKLFFITLASLALLVAAGTRRRSRTDKDTGAACSSTRPTRGAATSRAGTSRPATMTSET